MQGIPVYPGDEQIIAEIGRSGFWEVEGAAPVNIGQMQAERDAELEAAHQRSMTNPALAAWQRRGQQTPEQAAVDVEGFAARRGQAERRGQEQAMDTIRALQQAYGTGVYAPPPATLPGGVSVGEAAAEAAPFRDPITGLGPDTGYVPGMSRVVSPQGTPANVDNSFDWRVRGIDANKPWSPEMSQAERDRDERIALQKIQAKRDKQIAEAKRKIKRVVKESQDPDVATTVTTTIDEEQPAFDRFTPGQDRGMVDPGQAYPGSVRLGAPGPVTPGQQLPSTDDRSALERFKSLMLDPFPATQLGDTRYTDTMIREQMPSAAADIQSGPSVTAQQITPQQGPLGPPGTYSAPGFLESQLQKYKDIFDLGILGRADTVGGGGGLGTAVSTSPLTMSEEADTVRQGILNLPSNAIMAALQGEGIPGAPRPDTLIPEPSEVRTMQPGTDIPTVPGQVYDVDNFSEITGEADQMAAEGGLVDSALPQQLRTPAAQGMQFPQDAAAMGAASAAAATTDEGANTVAGAPPTPEQSAALERTWGQWAYDPAERKKKFLQQLNSIYSKAAWLDAIAGITGGRSRSGQYIQRAISRMEAIEKYDQEERLLNIWRDVYYTPDGAYDEPATKREAHERALRLGAKPAEASAIYGWTPAAQDLQQWYRMVDGELEVTQTAGKKSKPPQGDADAAWIMGSPPAGLQTPARVSHVNWTDGTITIALESGVRPEVKGYSGSWRKGTAPAEGAEYVPSEVKRRDYLERVYQASGREEAIEQAMLKYRLDPDWYAYMPNDAERRTTATAEVDQMIANLEGRGGQTVSTAAATGDAANMPATVQVKEAPPAAIAALKANPTEEMKQAFRDKYGYIPEDM